MRRSRADLDDVQRILQRGNVDRGTGGRVLDVDVSGQKVQLVGDVVGLVEVDGRHDPVVLGHEGAKGREAPLTGETCAPNGRHGPVVQGTAAGKVGDSRGCHDGGTDGGGLWGVK